MQKEHQCECSPSAGGGGEEGGVRVEADGGGDGRRGRRLRRGHVGGQRHPLHGEGILRRHFLSHQPQRGGSAGRHFQGEIYLGRLGSCHLLVGGRVMR